MAKRGLRTIGIAYKKAQNPNKSSFRRRDSLGIETIEKSGFTLMMLVGIKDILRAETKKAIQSCKKAGIHVIMVTGDSKLTARAIAEQAEIISSEDLENIPQEMLCMLGREFEKQI